MKPEVIALLKKLDEDADRAIEECKLYRKAIYHGVYPQCGRSIHASSGEKGNMSIERRLLTIKELADYIGVKIGTLYGARYSGGTFPVNPIEIPGRGKKRPSVRYDKKAVDAWIDSKAAGGGDLSTGVCLRKEFLK